MRHFCNLKNTIHQLNYFTMEVTLYNNLCAYLQSGVYPFTFSKDEKRNLRRKSKNYFVENEILYGYFNTAKTKNPIRFQVVKATQMLGLLSEWHNNRSHFKTAKVFQGIKSAGYNTLNLRGLIKKYIAECPTVKFNIE